ncbi:MAG: pyruvate:ferredoxin (flavodoxin) oxidoreductase [Verrucomicrobia bacterium]|nr:pyruvate:ferredoxin (flavodoxin) oxidoreductase [Verrucomicrobiota bacterium]
MERPRKAMDGNEAAAWVAYRCSEVIGVYPITPASPMGESADQWATSAQPNLWGAVPRVVEMQSEAGAAGMLHGALQAGALCTTFTASQGLLLMLPNLHKIAGELTGTVFHVAARSVATHALSIFGDHSDVMAARTTGWALLASSSVQEAMDLAAVAHGAALEARVPFLHFFDGFRTSHEIQKIEPLAEEDLRALLDPAALHAHRQRALSPDHPVLRGTAQNPDTFFQGREAANPFYLAVPEIVRAKMEALGRRTGRHYRLFDYTGAPDAERVIVIMGSGAEAVARTVTDLVGQGEKIGVVAVRLYRPFAIPEFLAALPVTARRIAVLDRTKEPGAIGEPLYLDVLAALAEGDRQARVIGGRYGLASKEFTPGMIRAVFSELASEAPRRHFTVGIRDDVTHLSLDWTESESPETDGTTGAVFWGLGSDGTVGANKNTIKIIAEATDLHVQGYFVYDSKKAGARTISHLRFGPEPIRSPYLIRKADFVGVHQFGFLAKFDILSGAADGATLLLNAPHGPDAIWEKLPPAMQREIIARDLRLHVIDAYGLAAGLNLGMRVNTIMQAAFFRLCPVLPPGEALRLLRENVARSYGKRGAPVVEANLAAIEAGWEGSRPARIGQATPVPSPEPSPAGSGFLQTLTFPLLRGEGDLLPVSAFPPDGTYPTGTARHEKRGIAHEIPVWEPDLCIQCGKCVLVCPHAVIRAKVCEESAFAGAPPGFVHLPARWRDRPGTHFTLQIAPDDCTGCSLCVEVCPARDKGQAARKAINMRPKEHQIGARREHWRFFEEGLPQRIASRESEVPHTVKDVQTLDPLFEFSGACAGCGETPYLKLISQLFGDRMLVANATGCSSIYGGNLPTTPWTVNREGRGPAWSNSLFEDNAEFGLGMRLAIDTQRDHARSLLEGMRDRLDPGLIDSLLRAPQTTEAEIAAQRDRIANLKTALADRPDPAVRDLLVVADALARKSVWLIGGDGWAYDIGFGGLDHVLSTDLDLNILVLDTETYSNTGGQASKSTPIGAVAKFASGGKTSPKKDLGWLAMSYGHAYVAQIAMGASDSHALKVLLEAEAHPGPSLVIAYSHCIAHGIDMAKGMQQQKLAERSGHWPLYRFDPARRAAGGNPFQLDSKPPSIPLSGYLYTEHRYRLLQQARPEVAKSLLARAEAEVKGRRERHEQLANETQSKEHETAT